MLLCDNSNLPSVFTFWNCQVGLYWNCDYRYKIVYLILGYFKLIFFHSLKLLFHQNTYSGSYSSLPPFKTKKNIQNFQGELIYHPLSYKEVTKKIRLLWLFTFAKKRYHFLGKKLKKKFFFAGPTTFKMPERALSINHCWLVDL